MQGTRSLRRMRRGWHAWASDLLLLFLAAITCVALPVAGFLPSLATPSGSLFRERNERCSHIGQQAKRRNLVSSSGIWASGDPGSFVRGRRNSVQLRCEESGREGKEGEEEELPRIRDLVDFKNAPVEELGEEEDEQGTVESRVFDVTRRGALAVLSSASIVGFINVYGDNQLNLLDSFWNSLFPKKTQRIRAALQPAFATLLSNAIHAAALEDLHLMSPEALSQAEAPLAAKAATFFPRLSEEDLARFSSTSPGGFTPLAPLLQTEAGANLALYATLHCLQPVLPSPKSRKEMAKLVGERVLQQLLPLTPGAAKPTSNTGQISTGQIAAPFDPRGAVGREALMRELGALLGAYSAGGYGVAAIGEKGVGVLDAVEWDADARGSLTVYVYDLAVMDAAQALAGESFQDLSEMLLPTSVLPAFFARFGVKCDAESYYLSSVYTRNPADYRPDCVAIQCNLEVI